MGNDLVCGLEMTVEIKRNCGAFKHLQDLPGIDKIH
jgi:hypothetical protein